MDRCDVCGRGSSTRALAGEMRVCADEAQCADNVARDRWSDEEMERRADEVQAQIMYEEGVAPWQI